MKDNYKKKKRVKYLNQVKERIIKEMKANKKNMILQKKNYLVIEDLNII